MAQTKTRTSSKTRSTAKPRNTPASSSGSSGSKGHIHVVEALRLLASRVVFTSEREQRDFEDHLIAALGDSKNAKEAEDRITHRLGKDEEPSAPAAVSHLNAAE